MPCSQISFDDPLTAAFFFCSHFHFIESNDYKQVVLPTKTNSFKTNANPLICSRNP